MSSVQPADLKKRFVELYESATTEPAFLNVPPMNFLMIDGQGDPKGLQEYHDAVETLISVSYATMYLLKREKQIKDYGIPPVESMWVLDKNSDFDGMDNKEWRWTAMIMQPDHVTHDDILHSVEVLMETNKTLDYSKMRFEQFEEGMTVQMLHYGPYRKQRASVEKMDAFATEHGCEMLMRHHEIYMTDPLGTDLRKIQTIVRHPVIKKYTPPE